MTGPLGRAEIEAIIPHRDPFLLLDEVTEIIPGKRVVARKLVREDEWYLAGHFPGRPIMPGVLMVEAMAQAGAVAVLSEPSNAGKLALFAGINDVRFKRLVTPGDELELDLRARPAARPDRPRRRDGDGGRRAGREGDAALRAHGSRRMISKVDPNDPPRRDHRPRRLRARPDPDERRPREDGRHERRVDHDADRHQGAAHRARRPGGQRPRDPGRAPGARARRRRSGRARRRHRRDLDAGHALSHHRGDRGGGAGREQAPRPTTRSRRAAASSTPPRRRTG